jgi:hypothetical protein
MRDITANRSSKCIKPPATWYTVKPPIQAINKITNKTVQMLMAHPPDLSRKPPIPVELPTPKSTTFHRAREIRGSRLDRGLTVAELGSLLYQEKPVVCLLQQCTHDNPGSRAPNAINQPAHGFRIVDRSPEHQSASSP